MKTKIRVSDSPTGSARTGQSISVRSIANGTTLATIATDEDGFATLEKNGHLEPYYLLISGVTGGVRIWRSDDMATVGPSSPQDWPTALSPLENGVLRLQSDVFPYGLSVSVGASSFVVTPGIAIIQGHPIVFRDSSTIGYSRPPTGTRVYRVYIEFYPQGTGQEGRAFVTSRYEDDDGSTPPLTQDATVWMLPLFSIPVPSAGAISILDERQFIQSSRHDPVYSDQTAYTGDVAAAVPGVDLFSDPFSITLDLPDESVYDIDATISSVQGPVAGSTSWLQQAAYGPTFSGTTLSLPGQIATDLSGNVYIADSGIDKLIKIDSSGSLVFTQTVSGVTGVTVDSGGYIYTSQFSGSPGIWVLRKWTSAMATVWTKTNNFQWTFLATDDTNLYSAIPSADTIGVRLCSDGSHVTAWGGSGSGNGQFGTIYGIDVSGGEVYVSDGENNRVQVFSTSGVYQRQWATSSQCAGLAVDESGNVWVADFDSYLLRQYTSSGTVMNTISQTQPYGIAVGLGDVLWAMSLSANLLHKWDEQTLGAGYGEIAIAIDGVVGTYVGRGNTDGSIMNVTSGSKQGGSGVTTTIHGYFKSTSGTAYFKTPRLWASARPRR